ncbi:MAG: fumarylacetoacetate hydrolase family protein [Thermodesulfobacteriota bacterium]
MRIIRFFDENDQICYGQNFREGIADLLEGNLFEGLKDSRRKVRIKKLLTPLEPKTILCIGLNYRQHAEETGFKIPQYPALFMKNPATLAHPDDPVVIPASCMEPLQVDYEVELAVVIGKSAKNVSTQTALQYVFGYTIANDISARRWQAHAGSGQWVRGKSFDTFCPLGPTLVTSDEIPDPQSVQLKCLLNGDTMQDANTSDMIFPVAELVSYLSTDMTLLPGTVILTGTPSGVGYTRNPSVYLKPGDMLESVIEGVGTLCNPIVGPQGDMK